MQLIWECSVTVVSAHSDFVASRMYACLGVTFHLHFWQNDRGVLRATAVTRRRNGHRVRVSTQSYLWRERKKSRRFCRDSNSQPFDHESVAPTNKLSPSRWCTPQKFHCVKVIGEFSLSVYVVLKFLCKSVGKFSPTMYVVLKFLC